MIQLNIDPYSVNGLGDAERETLRELIEIFTYHQGKNALKARYYEGHIRLSEVNLGLALPKGLRGLEIACEWGGKCVDVLASRSMFDGYVGADGNTAENFREIYEANRMQAEYMKACRDELKFGCTFATLSADDKCGCCIRFHSPETASAIWDGEKGRIKSGMAILDAVADESDLRWRPARIALYTDTDVWILSREGTQWDALRQPHRMERPLMEPLIWNPTSTKPFGRSRIKEPVRRLIQAYVRTMANATIGLEFSTAPQKYLLGVSDEMYDAVVSDKFRQYVGGILTATSNPETGEKPTFGQLSQGSIEPHVQMIRLLATQFAAATGLSVTDTGVINDANPTSSDAIIAQTQTLIILAQQLNTANGDALRMIARMAQAIARSVTLDDLTEEEKAVMPHFKNPAMPSIASTADAAVKIASSRENFSSTDIYLEMVGFDQADIRRIKAQEQRARGQQVLASEFTEEEQQQTEEVAE